MRRIWWERGEFQPAPDDRRARDVESRLDAVGDQHVGISEESGGDFRRRENGVRDQAGEGDAGAGLQIASCRVR